MHGKILKLTIGTVLNQDKLAESIDELEISIRSFITLRALGCSTLGDILRLSLIDILSSRDGELSVVADVNQMLLDRGLSLRPCSDGDRLTVPKSSDLVIPSSFGGLFVYNEPGLQHELIVAHVVRIYEDLGFARLAWTAENSTTIFEALGSYYDGETLFSIYPDEQAVKDQCLVLPSEGSRWTSILSEKFEFTSPQANELAALLSAYLPVLSLRAQKDARVEYALYRDGVAAQTAILDDACDVQNNARFDFGWFEDNRCSIARTVLQRWLSMPDRFLMLAGIHHRSFRQSIRNVVVSPATKEDNYLVFRMRDR